MGILSGLEKFGFHALDKVEVYEEEKKEDKSRRSSGEDKGISQLSEAEMLFEKTYRCPVCETELRVKTLRQGKARLIGTDVDLRPVHQNIDTLKYGAILCRKCGYAALTNYFNAVTDPQIRLIKENISRSYTPTNYFSTETYTYDEAMEIHKMALLNAVIKRAKPSEKAYICLKMAWLMRGNRELWQKQGDVSQAEIDGLYDGEKEYLQEAYKGFMNAIETESSSTICGMDSSTVSYLCSALAYEIGEYDEALRMISRVFQMPGANRRTKDKCTDLKVLIQEQKNGKPVVQ